MYRQAPMTGKVKVKVGRNQEAVSTAEKLGTLHQNVQTLQQEVEKEEVAKEEAKEVSRIQEEAASIAEKLGIMPGSVQIPVLVKGRVEVVFQEVPYHLVKMILFQEALYLLEVLYLSQVKMAG